MAARINMFLDISVFRTHLVVEFHYQNVQIQVDPGLMASGESKPHLYQSGIFRLEFVNF